MVWILLKMVFLSNFDFLQFRRSLQGFIADTLSLRIAILRDPSCLYSLLDNELSMLPVGFVFRKNWTWAKEIKLAELEMNEYNITGNHLKNIFIHIRAFLQKSILSWPSQTWVACSLFYCLQLPIVCSARSWKTCFHCWCIGIGILRWNGTLPKLILLEKRHISHQL